MTEPTRRPVPPLSLRPEREEDEPFLYALYASTREEELDVTGWDQAKREAFLRMQFAAQRRGYRDMFPEARFQIVLCDGVPAGRMVVHNGPEEIRLVDIVLLPEFRNQGLGARLLAGLIEEARTRGRPLRVSVFKPSRAAVFYQRLGFVKTGEAGPYDFWEWRLPETLTPPG